MTNKFLINKSQPIEIDTDNILLQGNLFIPASTTKLVIFVHGSGSSRFSPRNQQVATFLNKENIATLLFDLLSPEEEEIDNITAYFRFDIPLLAERLIGATDWISQQPELKPLKLCYFGASTGAAAALIAAAKRAALIHAVVSRGGRPDMAEMFLAQVKAPTLLLVGELDSQVVELNKKAQQQMHAMTELTIIAGASHLFEEPGTLQVVMKLATEWFKRFDS